MLLMAREGGDKHRTEHDGYNYPREDYDGARMGYGGYSAYPYREREYPDMTYNGDAEARFRDRRGREHYDNGRYAPKSAAETEEEPMARKPRRDDAGRSEYPYPPVVPPVYRRGVMNRIGFTADPNREVDHEYRTDANYPKMNETEHRTSGMTMGRSSGDDTILTEEMADEWMRNLHNEDGTKGPHWTKEQTRQVMNQKGTKVDPLDFYVVMNSIYSDYCNVLKKHNANNIDFYVDMASAWLNDKDAMDGKTARYFRCITK